MSSKRGNGTGIRRVHKNSFCFFSVRGRYPKKERSFCRSKIGFPGRYAVCGRADSRLIARESNFVLTGFRENRNERVDGNVIHVLGDNTSVDIVATRRVEYARRFTIITRDRVSRC